MWESELWLDQNGFLLWCEISHLRAHMKCNLIPACQSLSLVKVMNKVIISGIQ